MSRKLDPIEKQLLKNVTKTVVLYVGFSIVFNKTLDYYINKK